jgi:hypothetical protein
MVDIVQKLLNDVDTNVTFEANFETFLSLYFAINRLKILRPLWEFRIARTPPIEENYFFKPLNKDK